MESLKSGEIPYLMFSGILFRILRYTQTAEDQPQQEFGFACGLNTMSVSPQYSTIHTRTLERYSDSGHTKRGECDKERTELLCSKDIHRVSVVGMVRTCTIGAFNKFLAPFAL